MSCAEVFFMGVNTLNTMVSQTHPTPHATGSRASPQSPILLLVIPASQSQCLDFGVRHINQRWHCDSAPQLKSSSMSLAWIS